MIMDTKVCKECNDNKPANAFYARKKSIDGKQFICKECTRKRILRYRNENKESIRAKSRNYYASLTEEQRKERAKRNTKCPAYREGRYKSPERYKRYKDKITDYNKRAKKSLLDSYVIYNLTQTTKLTTKEIKSRPDLIELKRVILQTKRYIKNESKGLNS